MTLEVRVHSGASPKDVIPWTFLLGVIGGASSNGLNSMNRGVRVHGGAST